ncbi:hypothetical protein Tco_0771769 [Tanacetum coccineum]|uniref:Transposase-associated domain-containing protein n=1 Tax=Tanacetum coccineum TaxID=301880 RepID=A0ABQ4ZJR0_9ASTR
MSPGIVARDRSAVAAAVAAVAAVVAVAPVAAETQPKTNHSKSGSGLPSIVALVMVIDDKSWTLLEHHERAFYIGLEKFVDHCKPLVNSARKIGCPCKSCRTILWVSIKHLSDHIMKHGFDLGYKTWVHHGEPDLPPPPPAIDNTRQPQMSDMTTLLNDLSYIPPNNEHNEISNEPTQATRNEFKELYASANEELYPGCDYEDSNTPGKKVPKKVLRYFPIIPRLQRLYKSSHTTKEMIWHATKKCAEPGLQHVAGDIDNIQSASVVMYEREFFYADVDRKGVETIDVASGQKFNMRAMVLWTINDFPARSSLSGWSGQGYKACPTCNKDTSSVRVLSKTTYVGHRRFLKKPHKWRSSLEFNGQIDNRDPPKEFGRDEILAQLDRLPTRLTGKHLSYGGVNIKRNVLVELNWIKRLGIRSGLWLGQTKNGKCLKPQAAYSFTPEDRIFFCQFIKGVKLPDKFGSCLKHKVTDNDTNITGLKSHDCHIMMQRLLLYGLQNYLPDKIAKPIIELCSLFKQICSTTLMEDDMLKAQIKVVDILCDLELIHPPALFDIIIHLVIHLPLEALEGGPICPQWMFPFERYIKKLKGYVRNKAKPEGSIEEGYVVEEALTFSSHYFRDIRQRHVDNDKDPEVSTTSELFALACRPTWTPISVNSCVVDGLRYVVHSRDEHRTTQNSGICSPGPDREMYHEDNPDIIHFNNSSVLSLSTSLNDLDNATLHIDGQSTEVDAPPDIIDIVDEDDDIIDDEDALPYDLAYFDDEDLINVDDDGVDKMSADVARSHGGDGGGEDRPPPHHVPTDCGGKGKRKPNLGDRAAGRLHTRDKTPNLSLKEITDKKGPVPIRFEVRDKQTLMPLGDHATHWSSYIGEVIRGVPLYYPSWMKVPKERKATLITNIGFDLRPHMESPDWTEIEAGIQQHFQKAYNTNKAAFKAQHWVIDTQTGTYNMEKIRRARPEAITAEEWGKDPGRLLAFEMRWQSSTTQEYPSLIDTFFVAHTVNEVFTRDEDHLIYEEMRRLEATGTYTDDEINRLARRGKQRGHISSVGRVLPARVTASPKFESGGASGSGGYGDDEESADDQEDEDEDGDGDRIHAFRDDREMPKGEELSPHLYKAIEESRYESKFIDCISKEILKKICGGPLHVGENLVGIDFHFDRLDLSRFVRSDKVNMIEICGISGIGNMILDKAMYNLIYIHFEGSCLCEDVKEGTKRQGLIQVQMQMIGKIMKTEYLKMSSVGEGTMIIKKMMSSKPVLLVLDDVDDHDQLDSLADEDQSLELFGSYAFKTKDSSRGFKKVAEEVMKYVQGHPLALIVLGHFLYGKTVHQWVSELGQLKVYPNKKIQSVLRLSYDGLNLHQQNILLDIACSFIGENSKFVASGNNSLRMHDLIQAMAREIIFEESSMHGNRSRLQRTQVVEILDIQQKKPSQKFDIDGKAFAQMKNLRILKLPKDDAVNFFGRLDFLLNNLRLLCWNGCPFKLLPSDFYPENIVVIDLSYSNIKQLWTTPKCLRRLKVMKLKVLNLSGCLNVTQPPEAFWSRWWTLVLLSKQQHPQRSVSLAGFHMLKSLNFIYYNLEQVPDAIGSLSCLKDLYLEGSNFTSLPGSLSQLSHLSYLWVDGCKKLEVLPELPPSMYDVSACDCTSLCSIT